VIDRVPFLQRGLLPLSGLVSAMPIVGIAPSCDVVGSTGRPRRGDRRHDVLSDAGQHAAARRRHAMQRDLMHSYGASYGQTLLKLRSGGAAVHLQCLKINSTLR